MINKASKLIISIIFILVLLVVILTGSVFAYREKQIAGLPEYYKAAARRECGFFVIDIINPMSCCLYTIKHCAEHNYPVPINDKCPEGYISLGIGCGIGPGICVVKGGGWGNLVKPFATTSDDFQGSIPYK